MYKCSVTGCLVRTVTVNLCVDRTMTQRPFTLSVPLLEVTNVVFVCGQDHVPVSPLLEVSPYWRLQM